MIWSIAWRNVWRNKLRSMVVVLATAIGLYGSIFMIALMNGMMQQKLDNSIDNEISEIQIHNPKFLEDEVVQFFIPSPESVETALNEHQAVKSWCARIKASGMASTAHSGNGVMINGIYPDQEKEVTTLFQQIVDGSYFEKKSRIPSIIISGKLSDHLKADVGKKIVLTTAALNGETAQSLFRVEGIYHTSNTMFDEMNVFIKAGELEEMVAPGEKIISEFAVRLHEKAGLDATTLSLSESFPALSVLSWKELDPAIILMKGVMDQFSYILIMIVLLALTFGIVNVMLMVIIERTRELGMLMAIGMNKRRVFIMIMFETIFMSVSGAIAGVVLSVATIMLTNRNGINFASWSEGLEAYGYSAHVFPIIETSFYITLGIMVIMAASLASVWPARKALKLQAAVAIRDDS
ncbi:MAG: FtsX-like permease family protein [Bacteroidota bacterium]